ncbi:RNA polymerase sigma factor [Hyphococcus lacteus]|uniref:RNA polymerase sigma factor n=1 Tax=Hyphococcus lacteus TaxID=3143536 RepID=A0ABV3Z7I2_9PROT
MSKVLVSYLRHEKALKKYLYRFFSRPQDVDDIAQEAFIKVFATEARTEVRYPKPLLFRAAKHAALTELSKKTSKDFDYMEEVGESREFVEEKNCSAEEVLDSRRKLAALSVAISELPPVCRKVFILRKIEALPIKEIAARLKISVSSVEKHGAVGLVKCSRRMCELGYDPQEFGATTRKARDVIKKEYSDGE